VKIVGTQRGGVIRGTTTPAAVVEAVNASISPSERVRHYESPYEIVVIARADVRGRFAGKLSMRPNDVVRVRARGSNGAAGEWTTFRARGVEGRPRRLHVAVHRLGLRDLGSGTIKIFNMTPKRPIAEPGAELLVTNVRTGDRVRLVLNDRATIQGRARIAGRAGDELCVEAAGRLVGTLLTPSAVPPRGIVRPSGWHQKIGFVPAAKRFEAPLFVRRPQPFDVLQSELQNCYLASAAAAIAHVRPECLERAIAALGEGKYRVRFKIGRRYEPHDVIVTSDLYVRPSGELLYGSSGASPTLWWPVLEKAFAALKGSYRRVGRGGTSHRVFELLLGRPPRHFFIVPDDPEPVWSELTRAVDQRLPVVAGTSPTWTGKKFHHTGLVPDHAYAVLGIREVSGERRITIRNPWGEDVGPPGRVRRNGAFEITQGELMRFFQVISTVR
jgi:hypothetical protein